METHRIKVKIGDAEFDSEGPAEVVQAQFQAWMAVVSAMPKAAPAPAATALAGTPTPTPAPATPPGEGVPAAIMERVFRQGDTLSLAALPKGDNASADAMLALLYGYLKFKSETAVTGTLLMKSAKVSGVNIDRVDRVMNGITDLVLSAGVKKAKRYQLNNPGVARAEAIIRAILQ